jgi:VacB/RNase II family 3'-5' exoribonuclease
MSDGRERQDLHALARLAMLERGFLPDFSPAALAQAAALGEAPGQPGARDLTHLPWFSVDNDDSRDLDQISVAERVGTGEVRLLVGIADVSSRVAKGSPIDEHARSNTTSVYTAGGTFTMLPERLCFDLTSLNAEEERLAVVVEMLVGKDGSIGASDVYRARVVNHAKLAYRSVGEWLEGDGEPPEPARHAPGVPEQIRMQDEAAQALKRRRHEDGALELQTIEARAVFDDGRLVDLAAEPPNRAKELIENLMVAANGVTARFLEAKGFSSVRRVVRSPERWQKIVDVAAEHGGALPPEPDSGALAEFLRTMQKKDPLRFPDLSLVIVKLMGAGEYVVERPGESPVGHFGLAVRDYTHSTAPNRRYPDVLTQRQVLSALEGGTPPYDDGELAALARHCTEKEDDANKVERRMRKSAAALLLSSRIGERFDGVVTGASEKGTWVRIFRPPVEGKLVHGQGGLDVGDRVRVKLVSTDVERGFIDFVRTGP